MVYDSAVPYPILWGLTVLACLFYETKEKHFFGKLVAGNRKVSTANENCRILVCTTL